MNELIRRYRSGGGVGPISLTIAPGEAVAVVGPNGAGKTTLFRTLVGIERPDAGVIRVGGGPVDTRVPAPLLGYLPEAPVDFPRLTPRQSVGLDASLRGLSLGEEEIESALARFSALDFADRPLRWLSQGMAKRAALARAFIGDPTVLILDEPLNALDIATVIALKDALDRATARGAIVLVASHVLDLVDETCDRVLFLDHGHPRGALDLDGDRGAAEACYRRLFG